MKQQLKELKGGKKAAKEKVKQGEKVLDDILEAASSLTASIEN